MKSSAALITVSALLLGGGGGFLVTESLRTPADILERQKRSEDARRARLGQLIEESDALIRSVDGVDPAVRDLVSERAAALAGSLRAEVEATSAQQVFAGRMLKTLRALEFLDRVEKGR